MDNLLKEYQQSLKSLRKEKKAAPDYEQKVYAGMITDLEIAIYWLENGYPKGYRKGVHRKSQTLYYDTEFAIYVPKESYKDPFEEVEVRIDLERGRGKACLV